MRRLGFGLLGLVLGFGLVAAAGIAAASVLPISQAEGAYMMGVFFFWGPVGAVVGAVVGAAFGGRRP